MRQSLGTPNLYYIVYGRPLLFAKSHTYDTRKNVRLLKDNIRITDAARKNIRVLMDNIRRLQKIYVCCKMIYKCSFLGHCKKIYGCCKKTCGCCKETLPEALRTQTLTAFTSNFGLVGLVQYAWLAKFDLVW